MKKYILSILLVLTLLIAIPGVNAKETKEKLPATDREPINVYIFRGDSCGYCHSALEFFQASEEKYGDYFNLVGFEVSSQENASFWQTVADHFGDEAGGIPYIVVGESYHAAGYEESIGEQIIAAILEEYQNDDYVDVVGNLLKENKFVSDTPEESKITYEQNTDFSVLQNAFLSESAGQDEKSSSDIYIVIGIFVVLIGGVAGLVVASKK